MGDYDEEDYGVEFDVLESALLGEDFRGNAKLAAAALTGLDLDKKINLTTRVQNDIVRSEKKGERRTNVKGREDRATLEQVLDPRTRLILFKLMGKGFLTKIDGCLSTGKEANVYYAQGEGGKEYAVKIFKTSILVFKDRDKYVTGEYRFRHGYCKSNPRKMVKLWAEKEMRNLKRLQSAGLDAPAAHMLKSHVLIMDFLGKDGWCAPRLKDAQLSTDELLECYRTCVVMLRILLQDCGLIHGDFSEYNLLWHKGRIHVIDVSQSVELSHPLSLEFLRKDITNVNDFFARRGVVVLNVMDTFAYVTADAAVASGAESEEQRLQRWAQWRDALEARLVQQDLDHQTRSLQAVSLKQEAEEEVEQAVFMRSFIPTRLDDIAQPMAEMQRLAAGQREGVFSRAISTMLAQTPLGYGAAAVQHQQKKTKTQQGASSAEEKEGVPEEVHDDDAVDDEEEGDDDEDEEDSDEEDFQRLVSKLRGPAPPQRTEEVVTAATSTSASTPEQVPQPEKEPAKQFETIAPPRAPRSSDDDSDSDEDEEGDEDEDSDAEGDEERKYRRQLPGHDQPDLRQLEKQQRREARKLVKEAAQQKRKTKIPKHVKKRAVQKSKK